MTSASKLYENSFAVTFNMQACSFYQTLLYQIISVQSLLYVASTYTLHESLMIMKYSLISFMDHDFYLPSKNGLAHSDGGSTSHIKKI